METTIQHNYDIGQHVVYQGKVHVVKALVKFKLLQTQYLLENVDHPVAKSALTDAKLNFGDKYKRRDGNGCGLVVLSSTKDRVLTVWDAEFPNYIFSRASPRSGYSELFDTDIPANAMTKNWFHLTYERA